MHTTAQRYTLTSWASGIIEGQRGLSWRQASEHISALGHGRGSIVVHLLRGDVVIDDGLAVLQGRGVRVAADEVRWVQVWVGGAGSQVPGQVVGRGCWGEKEGQVARVCLCAPSPCASTCHANVHTELTTCSLTVWGVCCQGCKKHSRYNVSKYRSQHPNNGAMKTAVHHGTYWSPPARRRSALQEKKPTEKQETQPAL